MSFRKRNVGVSSSGDSARATPSVTEAGIQPVVNRATVSLLPGVRPSPIDGRPVTSTGVATLDDLLAGHGGLALGSSLLIEEKGTTDYAGALLRCYAAEGLVHGHRVYVVGLPEQWGRELPGLSGEPDQIERPALNEDKMKIAWRYEALSQGGSGVVARGESRSSFTPATCRE